jgi:hypothetical protein
MQTNCHKNAITRKSLCNIILPFKIKLPVKHITIIPKIERWIFIQRNGCFFPFQIQKQNKQK